MDKSFDVLIDEAISLELNIAELYLLFYRKFPVDSQFWWTLSLEEKNHAALLKTVKQMSGTNVEIPMELLPGTLNELESSNRKIQQALEEFELKPDRNRAFQFAYDTENSAGELHYDTFMKIEAESKVTSVFQKLNGDDVNHASRIQQYMISKKIPLKG